MIILQRTEGVSIPMSVGPQGLRAINTHERQAQRAAVVLTS